MNSDVEMQEAKTNEVLTTAQMGPKPMERVLPPRDMQNPGFLRSNGFSNKGLCESNRIGRIDGTRQQFTEPFKVPYEIPVLGKRLRTDNVSPINEKPLDETAVQKAFAERFVYGTGFAPGDKVPPVQLQLQYPINDTVYGTSGSYQGGTAVASGVLHAAEFNRAEVNSYEKNPYLMQPIPIGDNLCPEKTLHFQTKYTKKGLYTF